MAIFHRRSRLVFPQFEARRSHDSSPRGNVVMSSIVRKARASFRSWMFVYVAMFAAACFADGAVSSNAGSASPLSPVVLGQATPFLATESIARRPDI